MNNNLDKLLSEKYPKLFRELMGFEHGDGWFNIVNALCRNIQHHIDWNRRQRARAIQYNRCLKRALAGDKAGLLWYHTHDRVTEYTHKLVEKDIETAEFRNVLPIVHQVVVQQIKEKFGTLRFYYTGGDDYVQGLVNMAEAMSACTCETCGNLGEQRVDRWIRVLCDTHYAEIEENRKQKFIKEENDSK